MQAVLQRVAERHCPGVRLVQAAYHSRSLCLYTMLGFEVREPLVNLQGPPLAVHTWLCRSRATEEDLNACNALCRRIHGHDRSGELLEAITRSTASVVRTRTGSPAMLLSWGSRPCRGREQCRREGAHWCRPRVRGAGFLLPTRNGEVFRWCLAHGLRVVQPLTLMSMGLYNEPRGAFLPSIVY